jgi:carboxyl-terminal processing protease
MKNLFKGALGGCLAAVSAFGCGSVFAQTPVTVVEYYNKAIASYFITARANEIVLLDANPNLFTRTGKTFGTYAANAAPNGYAPVCRYQFLVPPSQFSSHFYGLPGDCAYIADTIRQLNLTNFIYEDLDFATLSPNANGTCPANAPVPIYRSFRKLSPVDVSNHRYSVNATEYAEMTRRGWAQENAVFCATTATPEPPRPVLASATSFENRCAAPRVGTSPYTGAVYPDRQGTPADEKSFLRSFTDETYLWYREVQMGNPSGPESVAAYFASLKTFAKTNTLETGGGTVNKDEFHFTEPTEAFEANNAGITFAQGIDWKFFRTSTGVAAVVVFVDKDTPASAAGVRRGDRLTSIGGSLLGDLAVNANFNKFIAAAFPSRQGEVVQFGFTSISGVAKNVSLTSAQLPIQTTPIVSIIDTSNGRVGYLTLTTFNTDVAEVELYNAFNRLKAAGVVDLVVDLRYNGGGLVYISSQLAYMIAGATRTAGKVYSYRQLNDRYAPGATPFFNVTIGRSSLPANTPLPSLDLARVYVLTTNSSASASETFISGLRGIDIQVNILGSQTRGKPYGFVPESNCGTTYFSIQQASSNNKREGDYIRGFAPTCLVNDDISREIGDTAEGQLSAALNLRATGRCADGTGFAKKSPLNELEGIPIRASSLPLHRRPIAIELPMSPVSGGSSTTNAPPADF